MNQVQQQVTESMEAHYTKNMSGGTMNALSNYVCSNRYG